VGVPILYEKQFRAILFLANNTINPGDDICHFHGLGLFKEARGSKTHATRTTLQHKQS
jgi:hypothetical protein